MAKNTIKGLTVEIGGDTTKLGKALESVNKNTRDLSGELVSINRLLKLDPGNVDLLAQKQQVLAEAISETEKKLDTLREAEKQVQAQFEKGEVSEAQYRELQREIIATENKLDGYKSAAKETQDAVDGLGQDTDDAADKTKELSEATDRAADSSGGLADTLNKGVAVGLAAAAAGAAAVAAALFESVDGTHDYRTAMGKLTTAFDKNGHSGDAAMETYTELQSVLGETDQAVEAANHLSLLADNEQELQTWTQICTGVFAQFGDSLPIEGLAEAANETAKVGQVTGPLADALNWAAKEGETFGLKLKENIDFTELSASELKKMTDAQREEYEARKQQYEAIETYNETLTEATSAEDIFNLALSECADEQERQELIMRTLSERYSDIADDYKEVNKDVIETNRTTERLNKLWAQVGKKATPIVNTFRNEIAKLGEGLVDMVDEADIEGFQAVIEDGFDRLANDVIPRLLDALKWVGEHFEQIRTVAVGFLAALAVGKVASFATSLGSTLVGAFKALVTALQGATTAQHGMNAAASANPYILLAQVVIGLATALGSYLTAKLDAAKESGAALAREMYGLDDAERAAADGANAAAEAFRSQRENMDQTVGGITSQYGYITGLKDELLLLADATGNVEAKDRARAAFILGELNTALGTEYEMTGNQISNYQQLEAEIDDVIAAKKAELLLSTSAEAYAAALKGRQQAENDYYTNLKTHQETQIRVANAEEELQAINQEKKEARTAWELWDIAERAKAKQGELEELKGILTESETAYNDSKETLAGYYNDIGQYETAQMLLLEGNTEEASKVMSDREYYQKEYADSVGFASDDVRNTWEMEAIDAGIKAGLIKENWENGVDGYTEDMVTEAQDNYKAALGKMSGAYDDAASVGGSITNGLSEGMESGRWGLLAKAGSLVRGIMERFRKEADSHSPSRKMIAFGRDMDEGMEIGLEKGTDDILKTAKKQIDQLMGVYDQADRSEASYLRGIDRQQETRAQQAAAAADPSDMLAQILDAIKAGQVLAIDGKLLVGGTADQYDASLGTKRALIARGAR